MPRLSLKFPDDIRAALSKRFLNQRRNWLAGEGQWPLEFSLGVLTEKDAQRELDVVKAWIEAWQDWRGGGEITFEIRQWRVLGTQSLPARIIFKNPHEVATCTGDRADWERASERYLHLAGRWPAIARTLFYFYDTLANYEAGDFTRLEAMLEWLEVHPNSNLYPRQLPIAGLDTKWLEPRKALVTDLINNLSGKNIAPPDFYQVCGLRQPPRLVRMRILDAALCRHLGGLSDISAPASDLEKLSLPVERAFIVENIQTGLAFGDHVGTVVIMGLGYDVDVLGRLRWLDQAQCIYWGDIDTHGFAILNRARERLKRVSSLLMDEETLMSYRALWVKESEQSQAMTLPFLSDAESRLFQQLKQQKWDTNVRLEQERIAWDFAIDAVLGCKSKTLFQA